jgi:peptidoglycan/LPS O-acetylase OafA/YrhL
LRGIATRRLRNDYDAAVRDEGASLARAFDARLNSLNFLRFIFASGVIVSHAWLLTAGTHGPSFGGSTIGAWSVVCFFVVSGFLVTRSRMRRTANVYYWDRFLRIVPAFAVVLLVTAFVFAPLSVVVASGTYDAGAAFGYVWRNLLSFYAPIVQQPFIAGTLSEPFRDNIWGQVWNGSLWSLFFEVGCYIAISSAVHILPRRWLGPVCLVGVGVLTVLVTYIEAATVPWQIEMVAPLPLAFLSGSVLWLYRDHIPVTSTTVALSTAYLLASGFTDIAVAITPLAVGIVTFWLGQKLPFHGFGREYDASYGVYIYGWPVQIMVILVTRRLGIELPMFVNTTLVLALVIAFAYASCFLVERPALTLRKHEPWLRGSWHHLVGRRARILGALTAGFFVIGTTAATATGNLPSPMQSAVATFADERLPFTIPHPDEPVRVEVRPGGGIDAQSASPTASKPTSPSTSAKPTFDPGANRDDRPDVTAPTKPAPTKPAPPKIVVPKVPVPTPTPTAPKIVVPKVPVPTPSIPTVPKLPLKQLGADVKVPDAEVEVPDVKGLASDAKLPVDLGD